MIDVVVTAEDFSSRGGFFSSGSPAMETKDLKYNYLYFQIIHADKTIKLKMKHLTREKGHGQYFALCTLIVYQFDFRQTSEYFIHNSLFLLYKIY